MEVTLNEAVEMTRKHNEETNVKETISSDASPDVVLNAVLHGLTDNPDMYNVGISHPLITFEKFTRSMDIFNYYIQHRQEWNDKGVWMDWSPSINTLNFWRTRDEMLRFLNNEIDENGLTFMDFSANNVKSVKLYTKGVTIEYHNGKKKDTILFDTIKD